MFLQIFVMFNSVSFVLHANKFSVCIFVMSCSESFVSDVIFFFSPRLAQYFSPTTYHFHARTARKYVLRTLHQPCCAGISANAVKLLNTRIAKLQYISVAEFERAFLWHVFLFCQVNLCEMGKPNAPTLNYAYDLPENLHHSLVNKFPHRIQRTSGTISSKTK